MSERIPIKCRICYFCNREEGFCDWKHFEGEPNLPFIDLCEEFKFEPLYLVDILEEIIKDG